MPTKNIFRFLPPLWLDEIGSTNDYVKERAARGDLASGAVVAALRQTSGRGRMDTSWESSTKGDLTFSFYWTGRSEPAAVGSLAMACALGVRDFLACYSVDALCKWPNDVLVGDAKICGILTEGGCTGGVYALVVGIGVNLRQSPGREERFGRPIAVLEHYTEGDLDPKILLPELLACLEPRIAAWREGGFAALEGDLHACLWGVGKQVSARTPRGRIEGVMHGLGRNGEMLLRQADGTEVCVSSVSALEGWT